MGVPIPPPPIPNEVISEILSYLGKNDLLKCRLVSQSWNELSLKILRIPKYGHEHELTQHNAQEFLEFSRGRNGKWVLPLHLNFNYALFGHREEHPKLSNYVQQLQSVFGETCVGGFTLSHHSSSFVSVEVLMSILTLVAPSLTNLDLSQFSLKYFREGEKMKEKTKEMLSTKTDLNFPNLSILMSCPAPITLEEDFREGRQENEIHSFLIAKSQNLKVLEVISPLDLSVIHKGIGSLKKLKIVEALQHLDTFMPPPNLPLLNDLSLTYSTSFLYRQILTEFLSSFSTSLQRLTIVFQKIPTNPFPRLSHLRFLCIQVSHSMYNSNNKIHVDPEKLNLNSEAFPVLESMDISTNVYFESTDANSDDLGLRTVKSLCVRVNDSAFIAMEANQSEEEHVEIGSAKGYVNQLHQLFPNLTSLTLVNESCGHESHLNELLTAFIQSDGAPRIQELEIQDYNENYLGHILNGLDTECQPRIIIENMKLSDKCLKAIFQVFQEFSGVSEMSVDNELEFRNGAESRVITCKAPTPIRFSMTGLEKIKIHTRFSTKCNEDSGQLAIERESNQKDLFLMSLPKHFPLLRQIDISERMFGDDKDFCKQQIVNVQEKFPNLIINTIH